MKRIECGQMTVFLSLLLMSFLLVLSVCIEGIYFHMEEANFMEQEMIAGEYAQANYHKELLEQFHLFAIDGRYQSKMEVSLRNNWRKNTGILPITLVIDNKKSITDENGNILKHQIREYMKYDETSDLLNQIKTAFQGVENDADVKQLEKGISQIQQSDDQEVESEAETGQAVEDPRKGLKKNLSKGILALVMSDSISEKSITIKYGKQGKQKDANIDFFDKDSVSKLFQTAEKKNAISQISTEGLSVLYAEKYFKNATSKSTENGIHYEMEYLIAGKNSDQANLKSVIYRLLAIRFALNYSYLLSSSQKQAQAYALATGIASVGAAVPGVVEGVKLLLLAAWAYGESIIELRALLKGNRVAFVKEDSNWQLALTNLGTLSAAPKQCKTGISYGDYLKILLLLQTDTAEKYKRMMDMIEERIQEKQVDFQLSDCIFSYQMNVTTNIDSLFYGNTYEFKDSRIFAY